MPQDQKVRAVLFDADGVDREIEPLDDVASIPDKQIYWLILTGDHDTSPHPIEEIDKDFILRGGVVVQDARFCLSVPAVPNEAGHSEDQMILVVGRNWLVTLSDKPMSLVERYLDCDTGETLKGSLTATALAVSLLMAHFEAFHEHLAAIEQRLDALDEQVFRSRQRHDPLNTLAVLRRHTARLRGIIADHRRAIATLDRPDFGPAVDDSDREHLTHLAEAYRRLVDAVDRTRDTVLSSYDLYATRVAQNTNRLLQRLTVITVGIGLIGALAGIFGMNFSLDMFKPEAHAFPIVAVMMATIALTTLFLAIRQS
ncbi:CorA family divalent cation transporter [Novosphingobium sp. MW5]|nr:CorA family divalent cation transporter [Novosphingobium sp. MW5]